MVPMKLFLAVFLLAVIYQATAQVGTGISAGQVRVEPSPATVPPGGVLLLKVGERFFPVKLDSTLLLRIGAGGLELAVVPSVAPPPVIVPPELEILMATGDTPSMVLAAVPIAGTLRVMSGGLTLTEPNDYSFAPATRTVTFTAGRLPSAGAILRAEYRK